MERNNAGMNVKKCVVDDRIGQKRDDLAASQGRRIAIRLTWLAKEEWVPGSII